MKVENTQIQMKKGILEFCILHIISRGEVYASDMLEELTSAKIIVVEGTLYPLLTRLRKAGLVDYQKDGLWVNYYLTDGQGSPYAASILGNLRHWLNEDPAVAELVKKAPFINREEICRQ